MAPDGYLLDPASEQGTRLNADVVPYERIADTPCLVLLGEPGMGKTDALNAIVTARTAAHSESAQLHIDLRSHADGSRLYRAIFESSQFSDWINSTYVLEVFLDSLDECLIHNKTVAALLVDEFRRYPVSRLRLRIACRAAEWPALLHEELPKIWGGTNYAEYELAPLRRSDVAGLAGVYTQSVDSFLTEVSRQEVAALAAVPITLHLLLKVFASGGKFPGTRIDLYQMGCLTLGRESSLSRRASGSAGELEPAERLTVAERIAAVTMFSKLPIIDVGDETIATSNISANVNQLAGTPDFVGGKQMDLSPAQFREVLTTGLFTSLSTGHRIWMHWTFAEFLAARWVMTRELSMQQVATLIFRTDTDGRDRVVPQLHETAAWLAAMNSEIMDRVMESDPQVLLRSTIASTDAGTRARIVDSFLRLLDREKATDEVELRRRYEILSHPDLKDQLLPYITARTKNVIVRRAAIDIAEACGVVDLGNLLAQMALDHTEDRQIRKQAAHAVARIGGASLKLTLLPLLDTTAEEDPDDELKGNALDALCDQLSGEEIFARLTYPRNPNLLGSYRYFVEYELPKRLKSADMPAALKWCASQARDVDLDFGMQRVVSHILERACAEIDAPDILASLAEVVVQRLRNYDSPFDAQRHHRNGNEVPLDPHHRRALVNAIVLRLRGNDDRYTRVGLAHSGLVLSDDIPWTIARLESAESEDKESWAQIVAYTFDSRISGHYDVMLSAVRRNAVLEKEAGYLFETVELDSPKAAQLRAQYEEQTRWQNRQEQQPKHPPIPELIARWLERSESGDVAAWWRLNLDLTIAPDSDRYGDESESDLTSLPGWQELDDTLRTRCIAAAERYVREADPNTSQWLGTNIFYRPAAAGYRALKLLLSLNRDALVAFSPADWGKWAPIIVSFLEAGREGNEEAQRMLVALAYAHAPDAVITTVRAMIAKENADHGFVFVTRRLASCWDKRLSSALLEMLRFGPELKPPVVRELLSQLLSHDAEEASDLALSIAEGDNVEQAMRVDASVALLSTVPDKVWDRLWSLFERDQELGRHAFLKFAHDPGEWLGGRIAQL